MNNLKHKVQLQNTYGFDLAIWNVNLDNNPEIIMTLK